MAERVFDPKIKGTLVLEKIFKDSQLDLFIVFSSIAAVVPGFGQADYSAACNFLDAYAHYKPTTGQHLTVSINHPTWKEVGVAVAAAQKNEIVEVKKLSHPVFHKCIIEKSKETYVSSFNPNTHWILGEHIFMGKPTLVGTAYIEIARAAYECHSGKSTMELREVFIMEPMIVEKHEEKKVQTILKFKEDWIEFSIQSLDADSQQWHQNASGEIVAAEPVEPVDYNINDLKSKCSRQAAVPNLRSTLGVLQFGPRWWDNFKWLNISTNEAFALLELPAEFTDDLDSYGIHPAILDTALDIAYVQQKEGEGDYLPYSYEKIVIKGALPSRFYAHSVQNQQKDKSILSSNLSFMDSQGAEIIAIKGFFLKLFQLDDDKKRKSRKEKKTQTKTLTSLLALLENGVLNKEGISSFDRIIASGLNQVLFSNQNFRDLKNSMNHLSENQSGDLSEQSELPEINQAFGASQSQIEQTIARVWERVLGIENPGVYDNFFDLGGDSLTIVHLRNKLEKGLGQKIATTDLFGNPTVHSLAAHLVEQRSSKLKKESIVTDQESSMIQELEEQSLDALNIEIE
jgi:acyl carrier protein